MDVGERIVRVFWKLTWSCDDDGQKGENLEQDELRAALKKLKLSNKAVWDRENARPPVEAPWWILGPYYLLCLVRNLTFVAWFSFVTGLLMSTGILLADAGCDL